MIIPAHIEADYIANTLGALLLSDLAGLDAQAIVVANGCVDDIAAIALEFQARPETAGWRLQVVDSVEGGKPLALDLGEAESSGEILIYLDADVTVTPKLVGALARALDSDTPLYGSGTPVVSRSRSAITRAYARLWTRLPLFETRAPGFGLFAMNVAGRNRWDSWPRIIGDDAFARLNFGPEERVQVPDRYEWPLSDGFLPLVRVRRRQDQGVRELMDFPPSLEANEDKVELGTSGALNLCLSDPLGRLLYAAVTVASRLPEQCPDSWCSSRR